MGFRARIAVVTVLVVLGVIPVVTERDSYPISTFPMFARDRTRTESIDTAVAISSGASGRVVQRLDPQRIAATIQPVTAAVVVSSAIARGQSGQLCDEIAARVARRGPPDAASIEVVTERYDAVDWFSGNRVPIQRVVHASCVVAR
jgi:hypothetical protein